jgi:YhcH/YjgK/YiaL family protein
MDYKFIDMRKIIYSGTLSVLTISILLVSAGSLLRSCKSSNSKMQENTWYSDGEWLGELQLEPSESVNQEEFEKLYRANPVLWKKAFQWMHNTDLEAIEPGTYVIEEGNLRAIVSDDPAPEPEQVKWEAHRDFSDIQYIVRGKATMGVASVPEDAFAASYDSISDVGFFEAQGEYFPAEPGTFFIFTPEDAHRPGIKVEGFDTVKKVVIKVRVAGQAHL